MLVFDAELSRGSLTGGTGATITGSYSADVLVGVPCAVSSMHLKGLVSTLTFRVECPQQDSEVDPGWQLLRPSPGCPTGVACAHPR